MLKSTGLTELVERNDQQTWRRMNKEPAEEKEWTMVDTTEC